MSNVDEVYALETEIKYRGYADREAEKIVLKNNLSKIWVISGIGVRNYYRKQGYRLEKTYLAKKLK